MIRSFVNSNNERFQAHFSALSLFCPPLLAESLFSQLLVYPKWLLTAFEQKNLTAVVQLERVRCFHHSLNHRQGATTSWPQLGHSPVHEPNHWSRRFKNSYTHQAQLGLPNCTYATQKRGLGFGETTVIPTSIAIEGKTSG